MSDTDTSDSDSGIRFKTTSTRFNIDGTNKYSTSLASRHSVSSHSQRGSRVRDQREKDRTSDCDERHANRRSRNRYSRSKSRSRSRENRKRQRNEQKKQRSRSRSRTKTSHSKRERRSSNENRIAPKTSQNSRELRPSMEQSNSDQRKNCDVSTALLSAQHNYTGKEVSPELSFGPALPPALLNKESDTKCAAVEKNIDVHGPALPPLRVDSENVESSKPDKTPRIIGPTLPAHLKVDSETLESSESELSPFSEEEHIEEDIIGPMPGASNSRINLELEQRALELKLKRLDDPKNIAVAAREDWMLQLPDIRKVSDMGLGARQFRTREKLEIGDQSVWTDTPSDKERKKLGCVSSKDDIHKRDEEHARSKIDEHDKQQEKIIKKYKKHKRDKSLLDIHQQKLEKKKVSFIIIYNMYSSHVKLFHFRKSKNLPNRCGGPLIAITIYKLIGSMKHKKKPF